MELDDQNVWGSRRFLLAAMLSQTLGQNTIVVLPQQAVVFGAAGHLLLYTFIFLIIGIPILYMEYVIGQFTGRDCLEVWKMRRCFSHVAYVQIFWQFTCALFNQTYCSFIVHYFLISFEEPIPYFECGYWSDSECNVLLRNYTVHRDCLSVHERLPYCLNLCKTFPEYQYWRYHILGRGSNDDSFHLAWRVTLATGLICVATFLSCCKQLHSVKWVLIYLVVYIIGARCLLLIGSMLQKGIVVKFEEAIDADFSTFMKCLELPASIIEMLYGLNAGTGMAFNLASKGSFRSPSYSNIIIVVMLTAATTAVGICTNTLMLCPYSYKWGVNPIDIAKYHIFISYEMIPRLLFDYDSRSFWLIINFSMTAACLFSINTVIISSMLEILIKRYAVAARYPSLTTLAMIFIIFCFSIPMLGNKTLFFMVDLQRGLNFIPIFAVVIECCVFVLSYGLGRFSEDIHFMLGVKVRGIFKIVWVMSIFVLIYSVTAELYMIFKTRASSIGNHVGWWLLMTIIMTTVLVTIVKFTRAWIKLKIHEECGIDPSWGPKNEILQRSRAMFTTHAMTKEYIYRQYHLKAGIQARQMASNVRINTPYIKQI